MAGFKADGEFKEYVYKTFNEAGDVYYTIHQPSDQDEDDDIYSTLVSLNDDAGATFTQIADLLEREFEELFE